MNVCDHCYAETVKLLRPVIDPDALLANYQSIRLNEERPEYDAAKNQNDRGKRNPQPLAPTRSSSPLAWSRRATYLPDQKEKQAQQNRGGDYKRYGHRTSIYHAQTQAFVILCAL